MALAFAPFAIWNADHAAQFYGSFIAAFVAAGAVVGNSFLQSRLDRKREDRARLRSSVEAELLLYAYIVFALGKIDRLKRLARAVEFKRGLDPSNPQAELVALTAEELSNFIPDPNDEDFRRARDHAAKLPLGVVEDVLPQMYRYKDTLEFVRLPKSPKTRLTKSAWESIIKALDQIHEELLNARAVLRQRLDPLRKHLE